jgi:hypothetical protein
VLERGHAVAHTDQITLRNAHFIVQRSGYERTVREKVKCVHAWVRGEIAQLPKPACAAVSASPRDMLVLLGAISWSRGRERAFSTWSSAGSRNP